jgi:hypothetical protein
MKAAIGRLFILLTIHGGERIMRILAAGIIGGIVMFFWSFVAHMYVGVGEAGVKQIPNEPAVVAAMKSNITEQGLYFVPGMDMSRSPSDEEWAILTSKYEAGPTAFLVYNPTGDTPFSARQLGIEFISNVLAALFGAFMLSLVQPSFAKRVVVATCIGIAAWLSINVSYWDWYRFPGIFVASELVEQGVGWFLSGLAMALIVKPNKAR